MARAPSPADNHGTYYMSLGWALTGLVILSVALRYYSRLFITRSFGSDDLAIFFSLCLSVSGEVLDTLAVANGLGRHMQFISIPSLALILKWEYILWVMVFISFFFVRTSVMLFTLRLLPATKLWSARLVCFAMFLNFAVTVFAVVSWGLVCVPFEDGYKRLYEYIPNLHCESQNVTVTAQKVNGILACIIDVSTALIPTSLVWNIRIKRKTKLILDAIFLLGLVTSALSIGRALTFPQDIWTNDTTWRLIKPSTFSLVEEKLGIIFASCPALRQFFVYVSRSGTVLPSRRRQAPNEDFVKMRTKVKLREILWNDRPKHDAPSAIWGAPIHAPEHELDEQTRRLAEKHGKWSAMDRFFAYFKPSDSHSNFWRLRSASWGSSWVMSHRTRPSQASTAEGMSNRRYARGWPGSRDSPETARLAERYRAWDWPSSDKDPSEKTNEANSSSSVFRGASESSGGPTSEASSPPPLPSPNRVFNNYTGLPHGSSPSSESPQGLGVSDAVTSDKEQQKRGRRSSTENQPHGADMDNRYELDVERATPMQAPVSPSEQVPIALDLERGRFKEEDLDEAAKRPAS